MIWPSVRFRVTMPSASPMKSASTANVPVLSVHCGLGLAAVDRKEQHRANGDYSCNSHGQVFQACVASFVASVDEIVNNVLLGLRLRDSSRG